MIFRFLTLSALVQLTLTQKPSPCPQVLTYEPRGTDDRWYGVLSIRTSEDLQGIWIRITLDRSAEFLGNWFGEASSRDNIEYVILNSDYNLEAGPPVLVRFFVKYNAEQTIPSVKSVRLNGKIICSTERSESNLGPTEPTLHISNQRNKPSTSSGSRENSGSNSDRITSRPSVIRPSSNERVDFVSIKRPVQNIPSPRPPVTSSRSTGCGVVAARASPLIVFGQETTPGQWPWHAALYHSEGRQPVYACGGTLISEQHILTAAHCVIKPRTTTQVPPSNLLVYLGKYNLATFGPEVQESNIAEIYVHPEYNYSLYYNDIAVLKLSNPLEFTNFVRPCCLWDDDSDLKNIIDKQGTVVGWGVDVTGKLSNKLMQTQMPIVSTSKCIYSNREFFSQFTFKRNYCAGFRNDTSVCNGDSGGGMVFPKRGTSGQNTVWQIRGLVSIGVAPQIQNMCDTSQYTIFTDVAKHIQWIRRVATPSLVLNINVPSCGTSTSMLTKGQNTIPGQWPWHAALYIIEAGKERFLCGGTLISNKHILTAAHCVTTRFPEAPKPETFVVILGKYGLYVSGKYDQRSSVVQVIVHPSYNRSNFFNDISILKLSRPVNITTFVKPVCLWEEGIDLSVVENRVGTAVGWSRHNDQNSATDIIQTPAPVVDTLTCLSANKGFLNFINKNNFCAGFIYGTSICNSIFGGGLVFPKKGTSGSKTIWQIRGILSTAISNDRSMCDPNYYVIFTDVAKYLDWIENVVR